MAARLSAVYLLLVALFPLWASAASILPSSASSTFPQCGLTCPVLTEAQSSCQGNPDQSTWTSCFCQSSLLIGFKSSGAACTSCSSGDQATLSTWYTNWCNSGGIINNGGAAAPPGTPASSPPSSSSSAAASPSPSAAAHPSWWSTHYQWVIMVIVLAIGFSALAFVGVWLKRRYDAKRPNLWHGDGAGASNSGVFSQRSSGVISPPPPSWGANSVPMQQRDAPAAPPPDVMPKAYGNPSRLQRF